MQSQAPLKSGVPLQGGGRFDIYAQSLYQSKVSGMENLKSL